MPTNNYVLQKEKAVTNKLSRLFRKNQKQLVTFLEGYETKSFFGDLKDLIKRIVNNQAVLVSELMKPILKKGSKVNKDKFNNDFELNINDELSPASKYISGLQALHLSQAKGSIAVATEQEIITIINDGVNEGLTYSEIGKQIQTVNPFVFSKSRSELIAVTEVGRAYEYGNWLPMKDLQDKGERILKRWSTVGDSRVRATHRQNEFDGLIPLDQEFSGTGDLFAPAKKRDPFRCRCATIYDVQ